MSNDLTITTTFLGRNEQGDSAVHMQRCDRGFASEAFILSSTCVYREILCHHVTTTST